MERYEERLLYDKREIFIWDDIHSESAFDFVQKIKSLYDSPSDIFVYIHSDGGELEAMASIIDEIIAAQKHCNVFLIVHGKAYSAGAFILSAAKPGFAFATPNSTIMLHPCSYNLSQDYKDVQTAYTMFTNTIFDKYLRMIANRTNKRVKTVEKDIKDGLWLDVKQAIKYGLIDGVWE